MLNKIQPTISIIILTIFALGLVACGGIGGEDVAFLPVTQTDGAVATTQQANIQQASNVPAASTTSSTAAAAALPAAGDYFEHEKAFISVFENASPSVVHIAVDEGEGSGFVYDAEGHIVTNNHVVSGANTIVVSFADGSQEEATIEGTAPDADLAIIKVAELPEGVKPLALADTDTLKVGQIVVAIGSPFGLENTLTTGIVSGLDRLFPGAEAPGGGTYNIPDIIQTDAAINPGNSGGPLLNLQGAVIGVNTAIESPVRGSSGVGFAVPANVVAIIAPQLIESGSAATPWLGISGSELNATMAEALGLDADTRGIAIGEVITGGPAADAGLVAADPNGTSVGDVIVGIDDQEIRAFDDLLGYIVEHTIVGQTVELKVLRDGQIDSIPLTLQARPSTQQQQ
ncbi:MAG: S1C family serine protease [Candidatus Promineifilaceae bacterium]|jgi:S1-C subfamily serine protease